MQVHDEEPELVLGVVERLRVGALVEHGVRREARRVAVYEAHHVAQRVCDHWNTQLFIGKCNFFVLT